MKKRVQLTIEYDGTFYSGWQRQANAPTVQEELEKALRKLTGQETGVTGASRTDAGVHAYGQSAHFDTESKIPSDRFCYALNTLLPSDIRVRASRETAPDFHARFSARGKRYRYLMEDGVFEGALTRLTHAHSIYRLDHEKMAEEAQTLLGWHDFAAFAASGSVVKDTVRRIDRVEVTRWDQEISLIVEGNGFLYNMVRIIAGTLQSVGAGRLEPGAFARAIASGNRLDLGVTAPAKGLTLMEVFYQEQGEHSSKPTETEANK